MSLAEIEGLGERLTGFWRMYGRWTRTKTRDNREYGLAYMSGLLRMEEKRNMANIGRKTGVSGQNLQHFMSVLAWAGRDMIAAMQSELGQRPELAGGILVLDESGEEKGGESGAGVMRQYNGRHQTVEVSQVAVFASYVQGDIWTWVDGELYVPEGWFGEAYAQRRRKAELPEERVYHKKTELAWQMIQRV